MQFSTVIGRFNPPTISHGKLIDHAISLGNPRIFIVDGEKSNKDHNKNPLDAITRCNLLQKSYGNKIKIDVCSNAFNALDIFDVLGCTNLNLICGEDRENSYQSFVKYINFNLNIHNIKRSDGISSTIIRESIRNDDDSKLNLLINGLEQSDIKLIKNRIKICHYSQSQNKMWQIV